MSTYLGGAFFCAPCHSLCLLQAYCRSYHFLWQHLLLFCAELWFVCLFLFQAVPVEEGVGWAPLG